MISTVDIQNGPTHHDHHGDDAVAILRPKPAISVALRESFRADLDARRNAQNAPSAVDSTLFARFLFYFDGFVGASDESLMRLQRSVRAHSGRVASFLSRSVTHIVASSLAASKLNRRMTSRRGTPAHLVQPDWITDSIAALKLQPTAAYRPAVRLIAAAAAVDVQPLTRWFAAPTPPPVSNLAPVAVLLPVDVNKNSDNGDDVRRRKRDRIDRTLAQIAAGARQSPLDTKRLRKAHK
jgi:hypothetical protein